MSVTFFTYSITAAFRLRFVFLIFAKQITMPGPSRLLSVIVGGVLLILAACTRQAPEQAPAERLGAPVAAMELQPQDIARRVVVSAPVTPRVHIRLASRTSGTVEQVYKEEGDRVAAGELLAELDMSEARAELARADAEEERARLEYERLTELRSRGVVAPAEYQQSRANLRFAESQRLLWQTRAAFGRILAPQAGVVTHRYIEPGEAVQQQDTLFELSAMDQLVINAGLSEMDVVHLEPGQPVRVRVDALPALQLEGKVRRIFPSADRATRLVTVEVALPADAAERGVRPGFLARLDIDVDRRAQVLTLPSFAIGNDARSSETREETYYVYVIEDDRLQRRRVVPGITRGGWTEIVSGVQPGETVLASNPIDLRANQRVRIVERRSLP